jgi:hypothetical protein
VIYLHPNILDLYIFRIQNGFAVNGTYIYSPEFIFSKSQYSGSIYISYTKMAVPLTEHIYSPEFIFSKSQYSGSIYISYTKWLCR